MFFLSKIFFLSISKLKFYHFPPVYLFPFIQFKITKHMKSCAIDFDKSTKHSIMQDV